jgi:small-conductance mechanosensitive channel
MLNVLIESVKESFYLSIDKHHILALFIFIIYAFILRIIYYKAERIIKLFTKKTKSELDDKIVESTKVPIFYFLLFLGALVDLSLIDFNEKFKFILLSSIKSLMIISGAIALYRTINILIEFGLTKYIKEKGDDTAYHFFLFIKSLIKISFLTLAFFQILTVWNINITPLLASAGIVGLAVALAAQQLISNLFGGASLFIDKTLKVGDRVRYKGQYLIVEEVNIRTTKFKTLENTYYIVPNSILASSEIENISAPYNEPKNVRVKISVAYGSDIKKVKEVLKKTAESVKDCIKNSAEVYFTDMADYSLDFLVVFKVKDASKMWPAKVEFLEKAYENLNNEGIEIPFPTQTIYLKKENSN